MGKRGRKPNPNKIINKGGRIGRPPNPNKLITPAQIEQDRIRLAKKHQKDKYKKLQLYYYFAIGREYLNSTIIPDYERVKIRRKLDILDKRLRQTPHRNHLNKNIVYNSIEKQSNFVVSNLA